MAARHFKYTYNSEIPPKTILSKMLKTNIDDNYIDIEYPNIVDLNIERNRFYFSKRKELKNLMKSINSHIDNNSQTLFLTLYYMDIIFTHKDLEKVFYSHFYTFNPYESPNNIQMNNYVLLSLACLIVASKFNENDPHVPTISSYIRLLFGYSKRKYSFSLYSLFMAEVVVLKLLKYKLNYYTIYHYLIYFFTHGIILKKTIENSKLSKKHSERKILEKIYIQAREILDGLIDSEKYFKFYFGKDNYLIVIEIFVWSIEHVINIKLKEDENLFKLVFNINIDQNLHKEMYEIIEEIYTNIKKKNNFGNKSTRIVQLNTTNSKTSTKYSQESEPSSTLLLNRPQSSEINFSSIEQKYIPNSSLYTATKIFYAHEPKDINRTENKDLKYYSGLIHNELERFNSNLLYNNQHSHHIQHQSIHKIENILPQSTISYGPNNRIYLNSNKNITSNYQLNSAENNISKLINSIKESNINSFQIDKEPIDRDKNFTLNYNNIKNIDYSNTRKVILINDSEKERKKKSYSCSKNIYNYNVPYNYNRQIRLRDEINNNNLTSIKLGEKNNKIKIPDFSKEMDNLYYFYNRNNQNDEKFEKNEEKDSISKRYQLTNNNINYFPNKSYNPSIINDKINPKFNSGDGYINRTKNLFTVEKINQNFELEPKDNNRRNSNNKYYINSGMKANIKDYNKANTIIINNNIHINTFIDKNNINLNQKGIDEGNTNTNLFLYNRTSEKNLKENIFYEPNPTNNFKNVRIKQKIGNDIQKSINKINKSSISFSHNLDNNKK